MDRFLCDCCGHVVENAQLVCPNCGFQNYYKVDGRDVDIIENDVKNHVKNLMSKLTDISIIYFDYDFDNLGNLVLNNKNMKKISDGTDCFDKVIFDDTNYEINSNLDFSIEKELNFAYTYDGKKHKEVVNVKVPANLTKLTIGVRTNSNLTIEFFIGSNENSVATIPIKLG